MAAYSRILLSGSTSGRPIKVVATATPGTTIHTAVTGATSFDEVWLWATNTDSSARTITVEWGGTTSPDDLLSDAVSLSASNAPFLLIPGLVLNGGLIVKAFASVANVVLITGYINRIS